MSKQQIAPATSNNLLASLAQSAGLNAEELENTLRATVVPAGATPEQFTAFLMVAKKYDLDPITKEIYAFPAKSGGIQPIVSIDGWLGIINRHPEFDGMEFEDHMDNGQLAAVTCRIYRKDRRHPTEVTEYMSECKRGTEPWNKWPARMLRHKATIQAARYAFGLSGIADPDEAERMAEVGAIERDITTQARAEVVPPDYPQDKFEQNKPAWRDAIAGGHATPERIIQMISAKYQLSAEQIAAIEGLARVDEQTGEVGPSMEAAR